MMSAMFPGVGDAFGSFTPTPTYETQNFSNQAGNASLGFGDAWSQAMAQQLGLKNNAQASANRQKLLDETSRMGGLASGSIQSGLRGIQNQAADATAQGMLGIQSQNAQAAHGDTQAALQRDWQGNQNLLNRNLQKFLQTQQLGQESSQFNTNRSDAWDMMGMKAFSSAIGGMAGGFK